MTHQTVPYRTRKHVWLRAGEPLLCPNGHKLKHNAVILQHEALICQHQEPRQSGECGARVYVVILPGLRFVAEVTSDEMRTMLNNRGMSVTDVLSYLNGAVA